MSATGSVEDMLRQADSLARADQRGRAAELYLGLLARWPGNRKARAGLQAVTRLSAADRPAVEAGIGAVRAALRAGDIARARAEAGRMLADRPWLPDLHTLMAEVLVAAGEREAALAPLMTAHALAPGSLDAAVNLARLLLDRGRAAEAADLAAGVLAAEPAHVAAAITHGRALAMLGDSAAAVAAFSAVLATRTADAGLLGERAAAYHALGETARARADLDQALALAPGRADLVHLYALVARPAPGDPVMVAAAQALRAGGQDTAGEVALAFALAEAEHGAGNRAAAFALWSRGNARARAAAGYDLAQDRALFARMEDLAATPFPAFAPAPLRDRSPVFIIGLPRSGTSLVEQILASHPAVHGAGERDDLPRAVEAACGTTTRPTEAALRAIRSRYLQALAASTPALPFVTDKLPSNFLYLGHICAAFPEARVIHVTRDPMAVAFSNFRHLFPEGGRATAFGHDLGDLAGYIRLHDRLMAAWHRALPGRILTLGYEALCADQRAETRRLLDHLGLPWDDRCLAFHQSPRAVTTVSTAQIRQPLYQGSNEAWRAYEPWLGPLIAALAPG